ncbi:hypothetical protein [Ekhidna sp.]|uniref:hypothetical protein n=1 Tax=Ekhidna sp. TaxID=2608089 RepID=UPI0032992D37
MSLRITSPSGIIDLDAFSFSTVNNYLEVKDNFTLTNVRVDLDWSLSKFPAKLFDPKADLEVAFLLRNKHFPQSRIVEVQYEGKSIGFVFTLNSIFDENNEFDSPVKKHFALRALIRLLNNEEYFPYREVSLNAQNDYQLADFYDEDLIICVLSKDRGYELNDEFLLSIYVNLNVYGFYQIKYKQSRF